MKRNTDAIYIPLLRHKDGTYTAITSAKISQCGKTFASHNVGQAKSRITNYYNDGPAPDIDKGEVFKLNPTVRSMLPVWQKDFSTGEETTL